MMRLTCPACGGVLDLPRSLTTAHCIYCGTKVLLPQNDNLRDLQRLAHLRDLCQVAMRAKNNGEVVRYCNAILELAPEDVDAWIDKAIATSLQSTADEDRFSEALEYLGKADELGGDKDRISATYAELSRTQAIWYNHLGIQRFKAAEETYRIYAEVSRAGGLIDMLSNVVEARDQSTQAYQAAMGYFLMAASLAPEDLPILRNLKLTADKAHWVRWPEEVLKRTQALERLNRLELLRSAVAERRKRLDEVTASLTTLRGEKGLFVGGRIRGAESEIRRLNDEIAGILREVADCEVRPL